MDSVREKAMNPRKDIGGGWYANQKLPKIDKTAKLSKVEEGIKVRRGKYKRWCYNLMFLMNWVTLE